MVRDTKATWGSFLISMAEVELRFGFAKQSKNLERYLIFSTTANFAHCLWQVCRQSEPWHTSTFWRTVVWCHKILNQIYIIQGRSPQNLNFVIWKNRVTQKDKLLIPTVRKKASDWEKIWSSRLKSEEIARTIIQIVKISTILKQKAFFTCS